MLADELKGRFGTTDISVDNINNEFKTKNQYADNRPNGNDGNNNNQADRNANVGSICTIVENNRIKTKHLAYTVYPVLSVYQVDDGRIIVNYLPRLGLLSC